jgi:hypothetical protein
MNARIENGNLIIKQETTYSLGGNLDLRGTTLTEKVPKTNSIWKHTNGNIYRVILITNLLTQRPDKYPITISYENIYLPDTPWSKKFSDWYRSMTIIDDPLELDAIFGIDSNKIDRMFGIEPCEMPGIYKNNT